MLIATTHCSEVEVSITANKMDGLQETSPQTEQIQQTWFHFLFKDQRKSNLFCIVYHWLLLATFLLELILLRTSPL